MSCLFIASATAAAVGPQTGSTGSFRLEIAEKGRNNLEKAVPTVDIPKGPLPISVDPNGNLVVQIPENEQTSEFAITDEGALVHQETVGKKSARQEGTIIKSDVAISSEGFLSFRGLDDWVVNWDGPNWNGPNLNFNFNLPGSGRGLSVLPLTVVPLQN